MNNLHGVGSGWGRNDTLSRFAMPAHDVSDGVFADTQISGDLAFRCVQGERQLVRREFRRAPEQ
ncbi:hypothetical protein ALO82_200159 [Pseudomonas syringae pv. broussonetiae]|nr:hypothetical protein ALO82_200159 [Pseudomonas syringae pv. broussonetiae]